MGTEHQRVTGPRGTSAQPHSSCELRQVALEVDEEDVTDLLSLSGSLAKLFTRLDSLSPLLSHGASSAHHMALSEVRKVVWKVSCLVVSACQGQ